MITRKLVVGSVLADFALLNIYAFATSGVTGFIEYLRGLDAWGTVLLVDLVIALGMVVTWMGRDARRSGRDPRGYMALTVALGSIGPLLYLLIKDADKPWTTEASDANDAKVAGEAKDVVAGA